MHRVAADAAGQVLPNFYQLHSVAHDSCLLGYAATLQSRKAVSLLLQYIGQRKKFSPDMPVPNGSTAKVLKYRQKEGRFLK